MNKTQEQLLTKRFKVNERFTIAREDYENMPDPMLAFTWSDERMEELARRIAPNLCPYDENDPEGMEDDFWKEMEDEAVRMGMEYYEDFSKEESDAIEEKWNSIK